MRFLLSLIVSALLLAGCSSNIVYSGFISAEDAVNGLYSFAVKVDYPSDSLEVNILCRDEKAKSVGMIVRWYGPDRQLYLTDTLDVSSGLYQYREGVVLNIAGEWGIEIKAEGSDKLRGVGLEMKKNGTR